MREISTLLNAEVVSSGEGKRLGAISQVVYSLAEGRLQGLILGKGPAEKGLRAEDIKTLGPDVVMVETASVAKRLSELPLLLAGRREPSTPPQQVVTEAGQRLGRLGRVYLDPATLQLTRFEVSGGAWRDLTDGVLSMTVAPGIIHGPEAIVVPNEAAETAMGSQGLKESVEQARESAEKAATQVMDSAGQLRDSAEHTAEQLRDSAAEGVKHLSQAVEAGAGRLRKALNTSLTLPGGKPQEKAAPPPSQKSAAAKPKRAAKPKSVAKPAAAKKPAKAAAKPKAAEGEPE